MALCKAIKKRMKCISNGKQNSPNRSLKRESVWKDIVMETIPLEVLEDDDYKQLDLLKSAIQYLFVMNE